MNSAPFKMTAWSADGKSVTTITGPVGPLTLDDGLNGWDEADERHLIDMVKHNLSHKEMGIHLNRSTEAITQRLRKLRNRPS
jgi:hypothetical protein